MKSKQILTHGRILNLHDEMTVPQLKMHIFRLLRPMLRAPDISAKMQGKSAQEFSEEEILEMEYQYFFDDDDDPIYRV